VLVGEILLVLKQRQLIMGLHQREVSELMLNETLRKIGNCEMYKMAFIEAMHHVLKIRKIKDN
jgi:hypothetical protein